MTASSPDRPDPRSRRARLRALETASDLFYANGVRAVGMEQIVEESGVAKTTIYRHFPTKDALIEAFLKKEDAEFWSQWDAVIGTATTSMGQIEALCDWIGKRVRRNGYRGCPQLNVAAEFADRAHPARLVARQHKAEMHRRLEAICAHGGVVHPETTAMQIALLFDGAFMSDGRLNAYDAPALLEHAAVLLIGGGRERPDKGASAELA
ncbi:TetR/AcrR family transcriptional regulator [Sphingomonas asaccharolytica]|uniref:TetR/AcrR family transcriptional regulator n=1 Tax=Sphingomonas asaccharolytica TaxID=40681 RepID=UPI00082D74D4|nr:TetR/AcrR family transcriptional regulator [Sphingomonas asaccharolytica]